MGYPAAYLLFLCLLTKFAQLDYCFRLDFLQHAADYGILQYTNLSCTLT